MIDLYASGQGLDAILEAFLVCLGDLGTVLEASLERLGGVLEGVER